MGCPKPARSFWCSIHKYFPSCCACHLLPTWLQQMLGLHDFGCNRGCRTGRRMDQTRHRGQHWHRSRAPWWQPCRLGDMVIGIWPTSDFPSREPSMGSTPIFFWQFAEFSPKLQSRSTIDVVVLCCEPIQPLALPNCPESAAVQRLLVMWTFCVLPIYRNAHFWVKIGTSMCCCASYFSMACFLICVLSAISFLRSSKSFFTSASLFSFVVGFAKNLCCC